MPSRATSTIARIKPLVVQAIRKRFENHLLNPPAPQPQYVLLFIIDNFNPHYVLSPSPDSRFCNSISAVNILYRWISADELVRVSPFFPSEEFSLTRFEEALSHGIEFSKDIDQDNKRQSLRNFTPYPCLEAQSSKYSDIERLFVEEILQNRCQLANSPIIVIGDTELLLILNKMKFNRPTDMKNLVLFPSI